MKNWRRRNPCASIEPTPIRNAYVPVPPASPVVSVSRNAQRVGCARGIVPAERDSSKSSGSSARSEMEMLPVARKPIVQYVVEELVSNGIQQILFVTGRSKSAIENHFDHDPELVQALTQSNKQELLRELDFEALKANFFYTRQRLQRGL